MTDGIPTMVKLNWPSLWDATAKLEIQLNCQVDQAATVVGADEGDPLQKSTSQDLSLAKLSMENLNYQLVIR